MRVESRRLQRLGDLEDIQARCEKVDVEEADITTISLFSGGAYKVSISNLTSAYVYFLDNLTHGFNWKEIELPILASVNASMAS